MPDVGYDNKPVKHELQTAPPDGYVMLRRLPYDEILKRREMATRLSMEQSSGGRRKARGYKQNEQVESSKIGIELIQVATREYEFANCIVDHNLEVNGQLVDFSKPKLAFRLVAPEVLQEIEMALSELNLETDEDELNDFMSAARPSSSEEPTLQSVPTESD
jgi:hypothetical protein